MKIAIPVEEKSLKTDVYQSFGRAPYFLIYNTQSRESNYVHNSAAKSQGGAGIKAAQIVADTKAQIVLTPRCGQNAAEVIQGAAIEMYQSIHASAQENLDAFLEGRLSKLEEIHSGFHNHGGE